MSRAAPAILAARPVVVTGGAGFIGSNLADRLAAEGEHVLLIDSLVREGAERNIEWLRANHRRKLSVAVEDVRNADAVGTALRDARAVFHLAAQVAVTTSMADPLTDFAVNVTGTLNILEALRKRSAPIPLIFASTNKVYGDLGAMALDRGDRAYTPRDKQVATTGISEAWPLDFHTPYGCSKGAADQYVLEYARSFALPTAVLRMSCIYGPRQMGTEDQGWVAHFLLRALADEPISIFGDGRQVRDLLEVSDAVDAYLAAYRNIGDIRGRAYNLGGGPANAVSLVQLLAYVEEILGRRVETTFHDWRPGDQRYYVSDTRRATRDLDLPTPLPWRTGVARLLTWLRNERRTRRPPPVDRRIAVGARA